MSAPEEKEKHARRIKAKEKDKIKQTNYGSKKSGYKGN